MAVAIAIAAMALSMLGPIGTPLSAEAAAPATISDELLAEVEQAAVESAPVEAVMVLDRRARVGELAATPRQVVPRLKQVARDSQQEVEVQLEQLADQLGDLRVTNRFWVTNALLVEFTADAATLEVLASVPGIDRIVPNYDVTVVEPTDVDAAAPEDPNTWGIEKIGADRVLNELGISGEGIRVATLDSGVDISHPDLADKMVTIDPSDPTHPGGWMEFDASGNLVDSEPHNSSSDHGTHVSGTIHGGDASGTNIGVAPGSDMMHGLVIPGGSGSFAQVAAGMQWAMDPTDSDGTPAGEPADVINMSLGAAGFYQEMVAPTRNIRAAGIVPAFAIGNEDLFGNCGVGTPIGSHSPGNVEEALGIGATGPNDDVADFSCGEVVEADDFPSPPADWPDSWVTPDLSAPGVDTYSSLPGGTWGTKSGTSMATPHTAGTIALMLSAAPELTVDQVEATLDDTSFWDDRNAPERPDTRFGVGRIDAYAATSVVAIDSGVDGTVTDAATGDVLAGAVVAAAGTDRTVVTGTDGDYTLRLEPGTYDLTGSAFGYADTTVDDVVVTESSFTTADIAMDPGPTGTIAGDVTFVETGEGVPGASVEVQAVPIDLSDVTDVDGAYEITSVPVGTYTVTVDRDGFANPPAQQVTVAADETVVLDFELAPPPQNVAVVGTYGQDFVDVLAPYGIDADLFAWGELDQAAQYASVITAYGSSAIGQDAWNDFEATTDANGAGVVFTDHAFGTWNGIPTLSEYTGQPVDHSGSSAGSGADRSYYEITQTHPILDGYEVGDQLVLDDSTQAKWMAWFDDYSGDGREVLALMGRDDGTGIYGNGIAVQQRATNRHALLSSHGVSVTRGPADWTAEAEALFVNALDWVTPTADPGQPVFTVYDLQVEPQVVKADEEVDISADVKNVGASAGTYEAVLRINGEVEASTSVDLDPGEAQEVSWTVTRGELGTYQVQVGTETSSFRVRPPIVDLQVFELRTADNPDPAPLVGATVELLDDGELREVGTTDEEGRLEFETFDPTARYTLVVRRTSEDGGGGDAYLLTEEVTIIDDDTVVLEPRLLRNNGALRKAAATSSFVTRVELAVDAVSGDHDAASFVRPHLAAPHGFLVQPGRVVASLGTYDLLHVHQVAQLERDWWLPSEIISDVEWEDPFDQQLTFGGEASLSIEDVSADGRDVTVDWDVTDAHGNSFATALATELRPFLDLPDVLELEDVESVLRDSAPDAGEVILRLRVPGGEIIRAGGISWDDRPFTFTVDDDLEPRRYRVVVQADTGYYSGVVRDRQGFRLR